MLEVGVLAIENGPEDFIAGSIRGTTVKTIRSSVRGVLSFSPEIWHVYSGTVRGRNFRGS